jgi:hypothetical protein
MKSKAIRLVAGIGRNDADYQVNTTIGGTNKQCPFYRAWLSMLERAYSPLFQKRCPTYIGCTVCDEWHSFMAFREWMAKQCWEGKQLDKDIIKIGNRVYCPDYCCFVTQEINKLLNSRPSVRGAYPQGVHLHKPNGMFMAAITIRSEKICLGYFKTPGEAASIYLTRKFRHLIQIAQEQEDYRVRSGLINHALKLIESM